MKPPTNPDEERLLREAGRLLATQPSPQPPEDFCERVLARLRHLPAPTHPAPSRRLAPILVAAGAVAALALVWHYWPRPAAPPAGTVLVRFNYPAGAQTVELAGDFTAWQRTPLVKGPGGFSAVMPVTGPGAHRYVLFVDGVCTPDPSARASADDDFGCIDNLLEV